MADAGCSQLEATSSIESESDLLNPDRRKERSRKRPSSDEDDPPTRTIPPKKNNVARKDIVDPPPVQLMTNYLPYLMPEIGSEFEPIPQVSKAFFL